MVRLRLRALVTGALIRLAVAIVPIVAEAVAKAAPRRAPVRIDPELDPEAIERDGSVIVVGSAVGERLAKMTKKEARRWARMVFQ